MFPRFRDLKRKELKITDVYSNGYDGFKVELEILKRSKTCQEDRLQDNLNSSTHKFVQVK